MYFFKHIHVILIIKLINKIVSINCTGFYESYFPLIRLFIAKSIELCNIVKYCYILLYTEWVHAHHIKNESKQKIKKRNFRR